MKRPLLAGLLGFVLLGLIGATTNLNITTVTTNQSGKETTINNALEALDQGTQGSRSNTITGNTTLSAANFRSHYVQVLAGSPGAGFNFDLPAGVKRWFCVHNTSGQTATVRGNGGAGGTQTVANSVISCLYHDGTNVLKPA